jgi:hypothetical protein
MADTVSWVMVISGGILAVSTGDIRAIVAILLISVGLGIAHSCGG